jgi:uncharacterized DUF497 family protein
MSTLHFEWD